MQPNAELSQKIRETIARSGKGAAIKEYQDMTGANHEQATAFVAKMDASLRSTTISSNRAVLCFAVPVIGAALVVFGFIYRDAENRYRGHPSQIPAQSKPVSASQTEHKPTNRPSEDPVIQSSWDGSVMQVKFWLKDNLNDPKSLEFVEWSKLQQTSNGYSVRCKFRAKNPLGALMLHDQVFYLSTSGEVISHADY